MSPPSPGPTLRELLALLDHEGGPIALGTYRSAALLTRVGDRFELVALHGGIIGVSPEDDRPPDHGEVLFVATGRDELVTRLVGVWTAAYGTLLSAGERPHATVSGDRRGLLLALRQRWQGGLALADATRILDGQLPLATAAQARWLVEAVDAAGGTVAWRLVA